jgi:hypothetical protein
LVFSGREKFEADRPTLEALENLATLGIGEHSAQAQDNAVAIDTVNDDPGARAESRREQPLATRRAAMVVVVSRIDPAGSA